MRIQVFIEELLLEGADPRRSDGVSESVKKAIGQRIATWTLNRRDEVLDGSSAANASFAQDVASQIAGISTVDMPTVQRPQPNGLADR